jgi:hypothetical protein
MRRLQWSLGSPPLAPAARTYLPPGLPADATASDGAQHPLPPGPLGPTMDPCFRSPALLQWSGLALTSHRGLGSKRSTAMAPSVTLPSSGCTRCFYAPHTLSSRGATVPLAGGPPTGTILPCRLPMTPSWRSSRSSTRSAARVASQPGPSSSPCSKLGSRPAARHGRAANYRSTPTDGTSCPSPGGCHQREVFTAIALNDVPIDVLAERRGTTRGALYKTVHDARRKLRVQLAKEGLASNPVAKPATATNGSSNSTAMDE